jgi:hypothetical protein
MIRVYEHIDSVHGLPEVKEGLILCFSVGLCLIYDIKYQGCKILEQVYGDLRKGEPLDSAKTAFSWMLNWIASQIRHFYEHLGKHIWGSNLT